MLRRCVGLHGGRVSCCEGFERAQLLRYCELSGLVLRLLGCCEGGSRGGLRPSKVAARVPEEVVVLQGLVWLEWNCLQSSTLKVVPGGALPWHRLGGFFNEMFRRNFPNEFFFGKCPKELFQKFFPKHFAKEIHQRIFQ